MPSQRSHATEDIGRTLHKSAKVSRSDDPKPTHDEAAWCVRRAHCDGRCSRATRCSTDRPSAPRQRLGGTGAARRARAARPPGRRHPALDRPPAARYDGVSKRRHGGADQSQAGGFASDERPASDDAALAAARRFVEMFVIKAKRERMQSGLLHRNQHRRIETIQNVYRWIDPGLQSELEGSTGFPRHLHERFGDLRGVMFDAGGGTPYQRGWRSRSLIGPPRLDLRGRLCPHVVPVPGGRASDTLHQVMSNPRTRRGAGCAPDEARFAARRSAVTPNARTGLAILEQWPQGHHGLSEQARRCNARRGPGPPRRDAGTPPRSRPYEIPCLQAWDDKSYSAGRDILATTDPTERRAVLAPAHVSGRSAVVGPRAVRILQVPSRTVSHVWLDRTDDARLLQRSRKPI